MQEDLLFDRSMMARLLGLLSNERLANEMSAVTRVIVILQKRKKNNLLNRNVHQRSITKCFKTHGFK